MTTTAQANESIVADAYFPALSDYLIASTGIDFYGSRPHALASQVGDRLRERGLSGCLAYLQLLQDKRDGEIELDRLVERLTIGETFFFRHRELFDALRDVVLPEVIHRNADMRRLRIWSAGCSSGAEAYSVSLLLRRNFKHLLRGWNISIVGTDINRMFLSQATEGRFEEWAFRGTPPELRRDCFEQDGESWRIAPQFKDGVTFSHHNLARHPFPSLVHDLVAFDLALCRNVLIYFGAELIQRVIAQLAECLVPDGWLAVGHSEHGAQFQDAFETVHCAGATLYRRKRPLRAPYSFSAPRVCLDIPTQGAPAAGPKPGARQETASSLRCSVIEQLRSLADQGCVDAALRLCDSHLKANATNAVLYFYQALLLDQVSAHGAALQAFQKAIYLDRNFALAHYHLGLSYQRQGDIAESLKSFQSVLRVLSKRTRTDCLPDADGLTVGDLLALTHLHIASLKKA